MLEFTLFIHPLFTSEAHLNIPRNDILNFLSYLSIILIQSMQALRNHFSFSLHKAHRKTCFAIRLKLHSERLQTLPFYGREMLREVWHEVGLLGETDQELCEVFLEVDVVEGVAQGVGVVFVVFIKELVLCTEVVRKLEIYTRMSRRS